jgi:hypothetical protein
VGSAQQATFDAPKGKMYACLPIGIIVGVQKGGTGELKTWLNRHASLNEAHGERHFWDRHQPLETTPGSPKSWFPQRISHFFGAHSGAFASASEAPERIALEYLLEKRSFFLSTAAVGRRATFEKTPAYFDFANPAAIARAVPGVRPVVLLREPGARMHSAYFHCQWHNIFNLNPRTEKRLKELGLSHAEWSAQEWSKLEREREIKCGGKAHADGFDAMLRKRMCRVPRAPGSLQSGENPRAAVRLVEDACRDLGLDAQHVPTCAANPMSADLRRSLRMGRYDEHLERWRDSFDRAQDPKNSDLLLLWSEDFLKDPFTALRKVEAHWGLDAHDFRGEAHQTEKGFWVLDDFSKSEIKLREKPKMSPFAREILTAFYAPSVARLRKTYPGVPWEEYD